MLAAQGYALASRSSSGWRGTFPAWLPVYDIDHVWLRPGLIVQSCTLFNGPVSDHRGQIVRARFDRVSQ
jgi:endonuclease/exonuclease/phosphatase family metal-dependent hydrolase